MLALPTTTTCGLFDMGRTSGGRCERHDGADVEEEHEDQVAFRLRVSSLELLPDQNAPERRHHGSALPDSVGDRESHAAPGDEVEGGAHAPDGSSEKSQHVPSKPALKVP